MRIINIILIFLLISCKTISNQSMVEPKGNEKYVIEIFENYNNLYRFLNDTNISYKFLRIDLKIIADKLYEHITKNKFQNGYKIEYIDTVRQTFIPFSNISYYEHKIKIRSNYNKEIIWIGFTNDINVKKWKISEFWYCNNPMERAWGEDVPCDKK